MASLGWPGLPWGARKEQKSLARAIRALEHLEHALGQDPHLEPSPPSLADLLPQMRGLLRQVAEAQRLAQGGLHEPGGASDFLAGYLSNLAQKGQQLAALFPAGSKAFWEGSSRRRKLTKLSLIFSHMHTELRALFPDGHYCGHTYQLSKPQAQEFWRENCGKRCVVPWEEFEALLSSCHPVKPGPMGQALKSTIDLTVSGHVSVFEFEVFTCLFQPWSSLLKNWTLLAVTHPGYMAFITYAEVKARLQTYLDKPGSYIFRLSCTRLGQWAIGHVSEHGQVLQSIPSLNKPLFQALREGQKKGFYLYPDGKMVNPDLSELEELKDHRHIEVSQEQFQLYCTMNSTFELCKICAERDKDTRLKPCGHLLCHPCLEGWQKSPGSTCPFCRCVIQGWEPVTIQPFPGASPDQEDKETAVKMCPRNSPLMAPPLPPRPDLAHRRNPDSELTPGSSSSLLHLPRLQPQFVIPRIGSFVTVPWDSAQTRGSWNSS
ncbi:E3 ubiquitin-protein ligase CBL-C isoform X2 [Monodelphis domestica]|uniref:E3 ubiquitin-protein ligase CBL-C isoform X2 n=1 Tax=Monodelphis domestica TaxID=13616 RepID=UPI0024E25D2C|nr:E3 ubiquitin-protein ligase CBL-C isoform X2 [Monodelphis domestica]